MRWWRVFLYTWWSAPKWYRSAGNESIWRRYRWHGVEKVLKGPVGNTGYTVPLPLPCERPRSLDPLILQFLEGHLGLY